MQSNELFQKCFPSEYHKQINSLTRLIQIKNLTKSQGCKIMLFLLRTDGKQKLD